MTQSSWRFDSFRWVVLLLGTLLSTGLLSSVALAQPDAAVVDAPALDTVVVEETEDETDSVETLRSEIDSLWTCLAAFLVFFMQAGFMLVECGFTRAKNAVNIVMKNAMDFSLGALLYWVVGFGLMFGAVGTTGGWVGTSFFVFNANAAGTTFEGAPEEPAEDAPEADQAAYTAELAAYEERVKTDPAGHFGWAFLIFQTVFAATAATIVSGAMAERTKFTAYLVYSVLITVLVYPIFGCWGWNGLVGSTGSGWLEDMGFYDFAGSTVVHSVGGWAALAGAIVIGPRLGKYGKDGKINPIPGHNIPMGALGVFILWLGWFGFNPGSTTAVGDGSFAFIAVTTNLSAAAGAVGAMITSWILFKKPDPSFTLNGALAGLVSITAGCDAMEPHFAALAGLIGGILVVLSVLALDRAKIDDPVGAVSVHGVCGAWGTLAVGLFMTEGGLLLGGGVGQTISQLIGIGAGFAWAFGVSLIIFLAIKFTIGLRVPQEEEIEGLDITEHGMYAYPPELIADGTPGGMALSGGIKKGVPVGV